MNDFYDDEEVAEPEDLWLVLMLALSVPAVLGAALGLAFWLVLS